MKTSFLLVLLFAAVLSSCHTVYQSGQTPDDLYYSPGREADDSYLAAASTPAYRYRNNDSYSRDDQWLRMRVRNPYLWNAFDNYDFYTPYSWRSNWSSPFSYNFPSYYTNLWFWNSAYNPYYTNYVVLSPKNNPMVYNHVRTYSSSGYSNTRYLNRNRTLQSFDKNYMRGSSSRYNNYNSTLGNSLKKVFSSSPNPSGNMKEYNNSSYDRPVRSYSPSSGGSFPSGGGRSSSTIIRPGRGN